MPEFKILEIRIDNLEKSVQELKDEAKEDRKMLTKAVDNLSNSLHELKENGLKLNLLLERTDEKLGYLSNKVDGIEQDIRNQPQDDTNLEWYQTTLGNAFKWTFLLLIALVAFLTGMNAETILQFFI